MPDLTLDYKLVLPWAVQHQLLVSCHDGADNSMKACSHGYAVKRQVVFMGPLANCSIW
jgi:hypothetical protein